MAQLRQEYHQFITLDTEIIVVGPEGQSAFQKYFTQEQLPFIGIPDPGHVVLKLFGQEVSIFKLGRLPAQVIIDKHGIVRYVHYGKSMADIPKNEEIIEIIKDLNQHVI